MKRGYLNLLPILSVLLLGCPGRRIGKSTSLADKFDITYTYPGAGVGGTGEVQWITIPPHSETLLVPKSIIMAVAELHYTIIDINIQEGLLQNKEYRTDSLPIERASIQQYNSSPNTPETLKLDERPRYALAYIIKYIIRDREIILDITSNLSTQGLGSDNWIKYPNSFSRAFFSLILKEHIKNMLSNLAKSSS